jgi:hypothetical protein
VTDCPPSRRAIAGWRSAMQGAVQEIFQNNFDCYNKRHPQPLHKIKAAEAIMCCRTSALGGHVERCPHGHIERIHYNSCKNRSCPQCNALPTERWLENQKEKLLDCAHFHVIFTLPHYLLALWWSNNRSMADLLFRCAVETLTELLADERYLGATVGIIASLHTAGRNLSRHPHLHCLVTGGGWTADGTWKEVKNGFLLPFRVVQQIFRGQYVAALRQALAHGELNLPEGMARAAAERLLDHVGRKVKWHVPVRERYPHGAGVATYLARYIKGGPLKDRQIVEITEEDVGFIYMDHSDGKTKSQRLPTDRFIQRLLWHVPEPRQHTVRYYGLYHPHRAEMRARCRERLGQPPEEAPEFLDWQTYCERTGLADRTRCPVCGERLRTVQVFPKQQSPPMGKIPYRHALH